MIATDNYSTSLPKEGLVERLSHEEALRKYKPKVVIGAWIPNNPKIGFDVLDFPSVNYFIDIGQLVGGATWQREEVENRRDWKQIDLEKLNRYSICHMSYYISWPPDTNIFRHSYVSLFRRKMQSLESSL